MSTIDERVVILEFNNAQFETNVKQSVSTLQKLKESLNLEGSAKGLDQLNKSARSFSLNHVADNIQTVADRFSALGIVGDQVLRRLTDKAIDLGKSLITAIPNQIISGGKRRAQNIEQAKFMLEGLLGEAYDWEKIQEDINYAVSGTAYGFDEAASAAGQLAASSVEFGDDMKAALRGISGVAAMTNDEYSTIAQIFTKIAGQGKVMTQELNQLAAHGINAAATLANVFDVTEGEIREMVHDGQVDFKMFSYAMDAAFGEHAKNANATFQGVLRNVKASLSRMGEQFATPAYDNLRLILVSLLPVMKDLEAFIKPISAGFKTFAESVSGAVVPALESLHYWFAGIRGLQQDYDFSDVITTWAKKLNGMTREEAQELELFDQFIDDIDKKEQEIKDSLTDGKITLYDSTLLEKDKNAYLGAFEEIIDTTKEGGKMNFNPLIDALDSATKTTQTLEKVEQGTEKVEKAVESVSEANKEAEASAEKTQKEYKKTSKYAKSYSNVQENLANNTKKAYAELEQHGVLGNLASKALKKLTKEEQKRAQTQADLSTENARNEKIAIEMSERSAAEVKKENLFQKVRNKLYQGATGAIGKAAQAAANFLGFNQETVKALASQEQMQQVVDDLADRTWRGEFGNGQERIEALGKLGAAYSIVQNRVNELLGCEKRHTVTAEDEAKMMEYVCQTLGISSKEGKRVSTIIDAFTKILAGLISALEVIKIFGMAIFTEIIQPFVKEAFQTALALLLPPLGAIGDALVNFYANLDPEKVTKFFSDIRESVASFWGKVQELEGVKKLKEAWGTFKLVLDDFRKKVLEKITTKFGEFRKNFKLPEGSFFLNIINNITNALSNLVDLLSVGVINMGEFFSPFLDWVASIPGKLKDFWDLLWNKDEGENAGEGFSIFSGILRDFSDSVNSFIDSIAPLKAVKDFFIGFWDTIFGKKDKKGKGIFGKMFGEADEKVTNLRKAWNEGLDPQAMISPFELLKERVDKFTDSIAPLKAVKDWMKDFWHTIFGKPGEGEDPASFGFGAAFEKLKTQISEFMDSIPILKTVKDWFMSIFNENLSKSISEIGKAISEFFNNLFGKQEEGAEPIPFGERFIKAAESLKEKIVGIFGASPELGKLLMAGGGIGFGILKLVATMKLLKSFSKNQNEGGIAGAIFGSARGGISKVPLIIGGLLGISAALNMFGVEFKKTTDEGEKNVTFIEYVWDKLIGLFTSASDQVQSLHIGETILNFLFGTSDAKGNKVSEGLIGNIKSVLQNVYDTVQKTVGVLFGDKNGKLGLGNATSIVASVAGIYLLITAFRMLGKALSGVLSIFTGAAGILGDLRVALSAYTDEMRANTFLSLAKALGIFALGLAVLAMVPEEGLSNAVTAISTLAIVLGLLMALFKALFGVNRFSDEVSAANTVILTFVRALAQAFRTAATMAGIGLLFAGIAIAVGVLVGAINKLANIDKLDAAMTAFAQIMFLITALALLSGVLASGNISVIPAMAGIAVGLLLLSEACVNFSQVDGEAIGKNLGVIAGALGTLLALTAAFNSGFFQFINWETGAQFALIAAGLILFAYSCKVLEGIDPGAIAAGLLAMAIAILGLGTAAQVANGGSIGGGAIASLSVALLGLAVASILLGNNIVPALIGLGALAVAFLVFAGIGNLVLPPISVAMESFNNSILKAALGVAVLGITLPILGNAFKMFGEIFFSNFWASLAGFVAFVAIIALLGTVSNIVAPGIISLGQALLMIAGALAIIVGIFTDFKGIRALINEISGGIGDIFANFFSLPGNMLSMFTNTSKAVKNSGQDYVTAADSYRQALSSVEGLSSSVISTLGEKLEELKDLDGSEYWIGVKDIVTYIKSLNLDEKQEKRVIERTLRAAEMQQKESYSLTVYNIALKLREHGADQEAIDTVFNDLQDMFNKAPGAITAKIFKLHTLVEQLNLPTKDRVALETAVDDVIQSTVKFKISLKNLRTIVNQSTGVDVYGKKLINAKIDEILSTFSYKTNIKHIEAWIKTSGIDPKNIYGFQIAVKKAIEEKSRLDYTLGTIYALVNDETVVEANEADIIDAINKELATIYESMGEGEDVEEVRSKIENVKLRIQSLYKDVTWDDGVEDQFETYVNDAFTKLMEAYEGYHASLKDLKIIFDRDGNLGDEQWEAFTALLKGLWSTDPVDIGELWVTCQKANMSEKEIFSLLNELGITLSEQNKKDIELSGVRLIMHEAEVPEDQQKAIESQLENFDEELTDDVLNDAEKFQTAMDKAVSEITKITGDKSLSQAMVEEYFQEKKDLQDASVGVLEGLLEGMIFGTTTEADYFQNKLHTLYGLYGSAFATELGAFIKEIKETSSLSDEDKTILEQQAGEILETQRNGLDKEYMAFLDKQAEIRRMENIGRFAIDRTTGASIGGNTAVSKLTKKLFDEERKNGKQSFNENDFYKFVEAYNAGEYTWEQLVGSFEDTGLTDEEIAEIFFPHDLDEMEYTWEGYKFMQRLLNPWFDGTSRAYQDELKRYGKYDFSSYYNIDENGKYITRPTDLYGNIRYETKDSIVDKPFLLGYNPDELDRRINEDMDEVAEHVRKAWAEYGPIRPDQPVSLEDMFEWYMNPEGNNGKLISDAPELTYIFDQMNKSIVETLKESGIEEGTEEWTKQYDLALKIAFTDIRKFLNKTGDGIIRETKKTQEEINEAYASFYNGSEKKSKISKNMPTLRDVFDNAGLYSTDAELYNFLKTNVIGFGPTYGLNLDELLEGEYEKPEDMINAIVSKYVEHMIPDENGETLIDQQALIDLYKAFPNIREYFINFLKDNPEISKQLGPEFNTANINKAIEEQIDDINTMYTDAAEKVVKGDKKESVRGKTIIQQLLENNLMTPAEMANWTKAMEEQGFDVSGLGEAFNIDTTGLDANGVTNAISRLFEGSEVTGAFFNSGKTDTENMADGMVSGLDENTDKVVTAQRSVLEALDEETSSYNMSASPSKLYKTHGLNMMTGLKLGIANNKDKVIDAIIEVVELCSSTIKDLIPLFKEGGSESALDYGTGIVSHPQYVNLAGATIVRQASDGIKTEMEGANGPEEMGKNFTLGFAKGISNENAVAEVSAAAEGVAQTASDKMQGTLNENSPSKVTMGYGRYFSMGFAIGIKQFGNQVESASRDVASSAIDALGNPLAMVQNVLNSDLDYDPTIRPVMDISGIQNGVKTINGMMPNTRVGLDFISNSMNRVKTTNEDVVSAISGLSKQMEGVRGGDSYTVNGVTYDDGSNISTAVKSLIHAARVERRA